MKQSHTKFLLFLSVAFQLSLVRAYECVEYFPGNFNLIISVPHGGYHEISKCPLRKEGCLDENGNCYYDSGATCDRTPDCPVTTVLDAETQEMAPTIAQNIENISGRIPHVVIMKCSRKSVDVNREIGEGAQNCPEAVAAHQSFHSTIERIITEDFSGQRGLLLDFHGQSHKQNSTEFGYAINKRDLDGVVVDPDHVFPAGALDEVTIAALLADVTSTGKFTEYDVVLGSESLGRFLEDEGFASLPGPNLPKPGETNYKYFNGGYTVRYHGSQQPSDLADAIQMETPSEVRFEGGDEMQKKFAFGLAAAIVKFFERHY